MEHTAGWYRKGDLVKIDDIVYRIHYKEISGLDVTFFLRDWMTGSEKVRKYRYFDKIEKG